jgi:hypothetical protein
MELKGFKKSWVMKKLLGVCQLYVGPYYLYICILLAENTLPQRITIPARWDDHGFDTNQWSQCQVAQLVPDSKSTPEKAVSWAKSIIWCVGVAQLKDNRGGQDRGQLESIDGDVLPAAQSLIMYITIPRP